MTKKKLITIVEYYVNEANKFRWFKTRLETSTQARTGPPGYRVFPGLRVAHLTLST